MVHRRFELVLMDSGFGDKEHGGSEHRVQLEITWKSIFRLLAAIVLSYIAVLLWPIFKMLILAVLIAVALQPIVVWVRRQGGPRWLGLLLAITTLVVVVVACFVLIAPMALRQMAVLGENLPKLRDQLIAQLPPTGPVRQALENGMGPGTVADSRMVLQRLLLLAGTTLGRLFHFVVVVALAIYLLIEGPRTLKWLMVFFPTAQRDRISQTLTQVSRLVCSYVSGQCAVSALCATYVFSMLTLLGVPMALLLGIVAGICDILPVVGFFAAVLLAMGVGLTLSPATAALIFVFYGAYHLLENFFIVPRVYGRKLRLSKLAVPLAMAAGGVLAGVVGAVAVLPIVAAYPVIERLWLAPKLAPDTLKEHEEPATP